MSDESLENEFVIDGPITFIAPTQTHKTHGIQAIEWRRLFGPYQFLIDELRDNINNLTYTVPGSVKNLDDEAIESGYPLTYRTYLRTCFKAFEEATTKDNGLNVDDELTYPSLKCFEALGLLPAGLKDEIIKGVPL